MKQFCDIDKDTGMFIKFGYWESRSEINIDGNWYEVEAPAGFIKPIFNFQSKRWIETATKEEISMFGSGFDDYSKFIAFKKEEKNDEMSSACQSAILAGFDCELNGVTYRLHYDMEVQINFQDTDRLFQNGMLESIDWTVYHKGEKRRLTLSRDEFTSLYLAGVKHKQEAIAHLYNEVVPRIKAAQTREELDAIEWGVPEESFTTLPSNTIDEKVTQLSHEVVAQKMQSQILEFTLLDVADIAMMDKL